MLKGTVRMIKVFLAFLLVISGCASRSQKKLIEEVKTIPGNQIKLIPVSSRSEALKYFHNQRNYLILLFEQSRDPYYGKPKWTEECLKSNIPGPISETANMLTMTSSLFLDSDGNPGLCPESKSAIKSQVLLIYCDRSSEILSLKFPTQAGIDLKKYKLCP